MKNLILLAALIAMPALAVGPGYLDAKDDATYTTVYSGITITAHDTFKNPPKISGWYKVGTAGTNDMPGGGTFSVTAYTKDARKARGLVTFEVRMIIKSAATGEGESSAVMEGTQTVDCAHLIAYPMANISLRMYENGEYNEGLSTMGMAQAGTPDPHPHRILDYNRNPVAEWACLQ